MALLYLVQLIQLLVGTNFGSVQEGVYVVTVFAVDVFGKVYKINKNLLIIQ